MGVGWPFLFFFSSLLLLVHKMNGCLSVTTHVLSWGVGDGLILWARHHSAAGAECHRGTEGQRRGCLQRNGKCVANWWLCNQKVKGMNEWETNVFCFLRKKAIMAERWNSMLNYYLLLCKKGQKLDFLILPIFFSFQESSTNSTSFHLTRFCSPPNNNNTATGESGLVVPLTS